MAHPSVHGRRERRALDGLRQPVACIVDILCPAHNPCAIRDLTVVEKARVAGASIELRDIGILILRSRLPGPRDPVAALDLLPPEPPVVPVAVFHYSLRASVVAVCRDHTRLADVVLPPFRGIDRRRIRLILMILRTNELASWSITLVVLDPFIDAIIPLRGIPVVEVGPGRPVWRRRDPLQRCPVVIDRLVPQWIFHRHILRIGVVRTVLYRFPRVRPITIDWTPRNHVKNLPRQLARAAAQVIVHSPLVGDLGTGRKSATVNFSVLQRVVGSVIEGHPVTKFAPRVIAERWIDYVGQNICRGVWAVELTMIWVHVARLWTHLIRIDVVDCPPGVGEAVHRCRGCARESRYGNGGGSDRRPVRVVVGDRDLLAACGSAFVHKLDHSAEAV